LAVVTNIPAPYRVPVYNRIAAQCGIDLCVFYAARSEPDRAWDLPLFEHPHVFLKPGMRERRGRFIHLNPDVWPALKRFAPDVILTTGYNPTHLVAWLYALLKRRKHIVMTDGTALSEASLSVVHRTVRQMVFASSQSFVVASQGGRRLLRSYGVADERIHFSPLCANTAVDWSPRGDPLRDIDLLFSARLVAIKNADFALRVAQGAAAKLGRPLRMALLGSGPEEAALRTQAAALAPQVDVIFAGHVSQAQLPRWFERARLFLLPSRWDPWGVVVNEACLTGVPSLVSPHAGVAGELVRDGLNGRVLALSEVAWVDAAVALLSDAALHSRSAAAAREAVAPYNFDNAAGGIVDAARHAFTGRAPEPRLSSFVP
jgi:glycosyltransferase involved in cell wall biosynthesis